MLSDTKFGPRWPKLAPSRPQGGDKLAQVGPIWVQVGPYWPQVGPSWPQVGPSLPQVDPKTLQNYFKTNPSGSKRRSETEKMQAISICIFFVKLWESIKSKNVLPTEGGKHIFENDKNDVHVDCDKMRIRENRKCAPHRRREALF